MKPFRILLQPYQLPSFQVAIQKFQLNFKSSFEITTETKELPMDDDGFVFFEVIIKVIKGNELALLYIGKFWGYES
jgi:hypothetical protein